MSWFLPHHTFRAYFEVTPDFLKAQGVSVLLLDIDNTLAPYEQPLPDERLKNWLEGLKAAKIRVAFLSNNHAARVELFDGELGLPCRYDANKPNTRYAKQLIAALGGTPKTAAIMGDQIFTDVWCARRVGARAFLVPPILDKQDKFTRFKRTLERGILRRYYKKHPEMPDVRLGNLTTEAAREAIKRESEK